MRMSNTRWLAFGLAAVGLLLCSGAWTQQAEVEQGVYDPLPLKERELHLLETASEYEELFVRRGYRYPAPDLETMILRIGRELAPDPEDEYVHYRFYLVDDPFPRGFSLPDGQIYVSTGMLAALENEAQLAALLAHEITHVEGHHGLLSFRKTRKRVITAMVVGPLTLGLSDYFLMRSLFGYSRALEREADERGFENIVGRGYDGREMARLWEILGRDSEGEVVEERPKWRSHPHARERAEEVRRWIAGLPPEIDLSQLRTAEVRFAELTRQVKLRTVRGFILQDYPRHAVDLARRLVQAGDDASCQCALGDALLALGERPEVVERTEAEKKRAAKRRVKLTREERKRRRLASPEARAILRQNLEEARAAYQRALALDPEHAEARRGLGYTLEKQGQDREAGEQLVAYLRLAPEATDRTVVLSHLKTITGRLKAKEETNASSQNP